MNAIIPYEFLKLLSIIDNIHEVRLIGWLIIHAQKVLKSYNKNLEELNMNLVNNLIFVNIPAHWILKENDRNYKHIHEALQLANKSIDIVRNGNVLKCNVIAYPELYKKNGITYLRFYIHQTLWYILLDFIKGWRIIDMPTYFKLSSIYSIALYILISNQTDTITYGWEKLRQIIGANDKCYSLTGNIINRIIKPAQKELTNNSPYTFSYTLKKAGRKAIGIEITPQKTSITNTLIDSKKTAIEKGKCALDERVIDYLTINMRLTVSQCVQLEKKLNAVGDWQTQIDKLAAIKTAGIRNGVKNWGGYIYKAMNNTI